MLNLFKKNSRNNLKKNSISFLKKPIKHYPSSIRDWNNSIYVFNKNSVNLIPSTTVLSSKLIKNYFNFFNKWLERRMRTRRLLLRLRRKSINRIYISNCEFKHTNNSVLINLYLFNRQKHSFLLKLKNIFIKKFLSNSKKVNVNKNIINILNLINKNVLNFLKKRESNSNYILIKTLNTLEKDEKYKINAFKNLSEYTKKFYRRFSKKLLRKIRLYFLYKQLIHINLSKSNYTYLYFLKKHLENIYNKNVNFNIINLKRFYLNSDILSETIKLKLIRNRRKLLKTLNKMNNKIKIQEKKKLFSSKIYETKALNKIPMGNNNELLNKFVLNELKYKHVTGFRLEVKGRVSKRYTASRSISKFKYKGNLLNIDSSYKGLSSVLLKGSLKSNIQCTKLNSKTRIGSFGIKGWVSGN